MPDDDEVFYLGVEQRIEDVTTAGPSLVAVGWSSSVGAPKAATVWMSADGIAWTRLADEEITDTDGDQEMTGVAAGGVGVVAVGSTETPSDLDAVVWVGE